MKTIFYSFLTAFLMFGAVSCSSDDDNNSTSTSAAQVSSTITAGSWRITNYSEDGTDKTTDFTGYNFTFGTTNTVTAANGTNTYSGAWSAAKSDEDDSASSSVDFLLSFSTPATFTELTEDWQVQERSSSKLKLRHTSGGDGGTDYLTFEKN